MKTWFLEFVGTALLLVAIVGSGIMASVLTDNVALQLLINAISVVLMLIVLINLFGNASGAHFNPVVTILKLLRGEIEFALAIQYLLAQLSGAIGGTILANLMFETDPISWSQYDRIRTGTFIAEVVATAGLLLVIVLKSEKAAFLVPAWIGSAYFFTSSTSFANPAATIGRAFTESWSGIAPSSILGFVAAQFLGLLIIHLVTMNVKEKGELSE